jgi:hypothetical protein
LCETLINLCNQDAFVIQLWNRFAACNIPYSENAQRKTDGVDLGEGKIHPAILRNICKVSRETFQIVFQNKDVCIDEGIL